MKYQNIKFKARAKYSNNKTEIRFFATEKATQNWANAQYKKDNNVIVSVFDFNTDKLLHTYSE